MSKFGDIVTFINTTLKSTQFGSSRFQKGTFNDSIAELVKVTTEGETIPSIVANDGQATKVVIDDVEVFQVYHRLLGSSYELVGDDFGNYRTRRTIAQMTLVVIANRDRLKLDKEDIILGLSLGMPLELPNIDKTALLIEACNITPNTYLTGPTEAYDREYNITEKLLKPQTMMIALDYTITMDVKEGCVTMCTDE